jgi:hypothetical protein
MTEFCTSDFSRQRALIVTNPVDTILRAVTEAIAALTPGDQTDVKRILVQIDQLAHRGSLVPEAREAARRTAVEARQSLEAGDTAAAIECLRVLAAALRST